MMKKTVCSILALIGAAVISSCAMADPVITDTGKTVEDGNWIYDADLISVRGSEGTAIFDHEGNPLTEPIYTSSFTMEYGYLIASLYGSDVNSGGVLNAQVQEVIPFEYGKVDALNASWILGYKLTVSDANHYDFDSWSGDYYFLIDTVDVYHMADGTAAKVATLTREQFLEADAHGDFICIKDRSDVCTLYDASFNELATGLRSTYDTGDIETNEEEFPTFYDNGQYGFTDSDGNVIMQPSFRSIYSFRSGYAEVYTGTYYGLIDTQGNVVVPAEYDEVNSSYYGPYNAHESTCSIYNAAGYYAVVKNGKLGFVDSNGQLTFEPAISESLMDLYGASATYTDMGGEFHILAADGTDSIVPAEYTTVRALSYGSGLLYTINDADYNEGLMDWHGNILLDCIYDDISLSASGKYLLVREDYSDPAAIYEVTYDAAPASAAAEPSGDVSLTETEAGLPLEGTPEPAPAQENTEAAPAADEDPTIAAAKQLLETAKTLLAAGGEFDAQTVSSLLNSAVTLLESKSPAAAALVESAISLVDTGIVDAATISSLIDHALAFF